MTFILVATQDIHTACCTAARRNFPEAPERWTQPFGGLHFIACGDFAQHQPVTGRSLFVGAADADYLAGLSTIVLTDGKKRGRGDDYATNNKNIRGRALWVDFKYCIILKQQHRFGNDADGQALYDLVYRLTHSCRRDGTPLSDTDIANLADLLNSRAIAPADLPDFLRRRPKAIVLRHAVRPALTSLLVQHHAAAVNSRVICWRARDIGYNPDVKKSAIPLSAPILKILEQYSDNDTPPAIQYFYPGIPYRFIGQTGYPAIGWFNNGSCIGQELVLDPREPPDTLTGDFWSLKYRPKAIIVRLPHRKLGKLCGPGITEDCVPVMETLSGGVKCKLPTFTKLYKEPRDKTMDMYVNFKRLSFPLDTALAFTDYFAQGVSFRGDPHFLHLNLPPRQTFKRANLLVPVSRPAKLSDVVLLQPLWKTGDVSERERVIKMISGALKFDPDYTAEMDRLQQKATETRDALYPTLMHNTTEATTPQHTCIGKFAVLCSPHTQATCLHCLSVRNHNTLNCLG